MIWTHGALAAVFASALATAAGAATMQPIDLTPWAAEGLPGSSNWQVSGDGSSVRQTVNSTPTVFTGGGSAQGYRYNGVVAVDTANDDDFFGFVLGYDSGDLGGASEFLVIDWKQATQKLGRNPGTGLAGLALSRVTGNINTGTSTAPNANAFHHTGVVQELARGATLGSTGWADFAAYTFDIAFTATNVTVSVNGVEQIDYTLSSGSFDDGKFGFYNLSQDNVVYSAFTYGLINPPPPPSPVPLPAGAPLLALGLGGLAIARRSRA